MIAAAMFALGQKRTLAGLCIMSALPPKADIRQGNRDVRFLPKADISSVWKFKAPARSAFTGKYRSRLQWN
jgi:hypothetical protein